MITERTCSLCGASSLIVPLVEADGAWACEWGAYCRVRRRAGLRPVRPLPPEPPHGGWLAPLAFTLGVVLVCGGVVAGLLTVTHLVGWA